MTQPLLDLEPRILLRTTVAGEPIPQGSKTPIHRGGKTWLIDDNPRLAPWRQTMTRRFAAHVDPAGAGYDGPVEVRACFAFPIPATAPKSWRTLARYDHAATTADVDKCARALLDALQAARVISNDARVVVLVVEKRYAGHPRGPLTNPGVAVEVRAL